MIHRKYPGLASVAVQCKELWMKPVSCLISATQHSQWNISHPERGPGLVRRLKICWWNSRRKDTFSFFVVSLNRLNHRVGNNWALFLGFCIVQFVNSDECSHLACIIWTQHLWSHSPSSPVNATSATNSLATLHTTLDTPDKENRICKYWKSTKNVEYWL